MTRRRGPSAPSKQAQASFIATPETARAFLLGKGGLNEKQVDLALQARDLTVDVRAVFSAYMALRVAASEGWGPSATLPPPEGLVLRIPLPVHGHPTVLHRLAGVSRIAEGLNNFIRVPTYRPAFIQWAGKYKPFSLIERLNKDSRRLEVVIIDTVVEAAGLPELNERHFTALAVLPPNPLEPPEPRVPMAKSRALKWRYAIKTHDTAYLALSQLDELPPPPVSSTRSDGSQGPSGSRKQDSTVADLLRRLTGLGAEG
jgi:hypothetical protein